MRCQGLCTFFLFLPYTVDPDKSTQLYSCTELYMQLTRPAAGNKAGAACVTS